MAPTTLDANVAFWIRQNKSHCLEFFWWRVLNSWWPFSSFQCHIWGLLPLMCLAFVLFFNKTVDQPLEVLDRFFQFWTDFKADFWGLKRPLEQRIIKNTFVVISIFPCIPERMACRALLFIGGKSYSVLWCLAIRFPKLPFIGLNIVNLFHNGGEKTLLLLI